MSSWHSTWPLTPLSLRGIFALMIHLHTHMHNQLKSTQTQKLPSSQLGSHLPIRQRKLAYCDPSATLCLNCSPSACRNERWSVYSGYAFGLPLQFSLHFSSSGCKSMEEGGFNDAVTHLRIKKLKCYKGVRSGHVRENFSFSIQYTVCVCTHFCLKWVIPRLSCMSEFFPLTFLPKASSILLFKL